MPVYEYECEDCGRRFDRLVFRQDEEVTCPECAGARVKKRFSVFAAGPSDGGRRGAPQAPA